MTHKELKKKVLQLKWEFWAARPFSAFILSLFKDGQTRAYMRRFGVDAEWPSMFYQKNAFYKSEEVWDNFADQLNIYLHKGGSVFKVAGLCEKFHKQELTKVVKLANETGDPIKKLADLYEILTQTVSFTWLAHGFEHIYVKKLRLEVPKYYKDDCEKFIGDISYPVKKMLMYIWSKR